MYVKFTVVAMQIESSPSIAHSAWVAPGAHVIGGVTMCAHALVVALFTLRSSGPFELSLSTLQRSSVFGVVQLSAACRW